MRDWNAEVRARLASLRLPPEREAQIADEVAQHLEQLSESEALAELDARDFATEFRGVARSVPREPDSFISSIWYDVRITARSLMRAPALAAAVTLTLALGIGSTTAIFSVVYGVLLRPLPYQDSGRIMSVFELNNAGARSGIADPNFDDFRDQSHSFQSLAKYGNSVSSVSGASQPTRTLVAGVSADFLKVFRVQPARGRGFDESDQKPGAGPTALVSYRYWSQYLGATADLSQVHIKISGRPVTVIGVMPADFAFPTGTDIWLPADLRGKNGSRTAHNYRAVGRLKDNVNPEQAAADVSGIARHIHETSSEQGDYLLKDATVVPLQDAITGRARTPLLALLGAVGFLLLVACGNVANLLLARASVRSRELAIRTALGAARGRLIRQFVTEGFLFAAGGAGLGVLGAVAAVKELIALAPPSIPRLSEVSVSVPVMAFAILLTSAIAIGLGIFTATRATSGDMRATLGEGGRGQAGSQRAQRVGRVIVAAQMAITLVLVVGAGLFGRSLMKVLNVNPGFRVDSVVTMDVSLPSTFDANGRASEIAFYAQLLDRLKYVPGVRDAGATSGLPTDGGFPDGRFILISPSEMPKTSEGFAPFLQQKDRLGNADFAVTTAGYFKVMDIPLVRGRMFDERDGENDPHAALITESLAKQRWPNQDPIGRTIEFGNMDGDMRLLTVVGVVGNTHEYGLDAPPQPTVYVNFFQRPHPAMSITMLSDADPRSIINAAQTIVHDLNPDVPAKFRTMSQLVSASMGSRRFNLILVGFFGIVALLLATTGVFGVMAYSVSRRTKEIGVRVALGATSGGVVRMILGQGMRTTLVGVVIGLAGAIALTRTIQSMLFGVTATDPATFVGVTALLISVALAACFVPAWRAAKVDPTEALRSE